MVCTMERPNPVPTPFCFVVKYGSAFAPYFRRHAAAGIANRELDMLSGFMGARSHDSFKRQRHFECSGLARHHGMIGIGAQVHD